eukprot:TRINITY_DN579_c0_g1_i22.p2 TRINITY_DN579_c0_g1~~TRINITY_DN579_c0_g1_i22.p2  ORF type:complete len:129 (-),score=24.38 TRINITY_DN579_c0_g1_i22:216-602(-)
MSVTLAKQDKSTISKEEQEKRKPSPMLVTFDKEDMLEIIFKDEHSYKKPTPMSVTFAKQDKSTKKNRKIGNSHQCWSPKKNRKKGNPHQCWSHLIRKTCRILSSKTSILLKNGDQCSEYSVGLKSLSR